MRLVFDKETCQKFAVKSISKKTFSVGVRDALRWRYLVVYLWMGRTALEEVKIL